MHKLLELIGLVLAELFDGDLLLLFLDGGVLLLLGAAWKTLPWERAFEEVEENVPDGLEVVSSGLLITDVSVDRSIPSGSSEILAVSEGDVLTL